MAKNVFSIELDLHKYCASDERIQCEMLVGDMARLSYRLTNCMSSKNLNKKLVRINLLSICAAADRLPADNFVEPHRRRFMTLTI